MTTGLFEVIAANDENPRLAARQALLVAQARIEQQLGDFLKLAKTPEEFDARFSMVEDEFAGIVLVACDECGHENPSSTAQSLHDHFRPTAAGCACCSGDDCNGSCCGGSGKCSKCGSEHGSGSDKESSRVASVNAEDGSQRVSEVSMPLDPRDPANLPGTELGGNPADASTQEGVAFAPTPGPAAPAAAGGAPGTMTHQQLQALQLAQQISQGAMSGEIHNLQDVQRLVNAKSEGPSWEAHEVIAGKPPWLKDEDEKDPDEPGEDTDVDDAIDKKEGSSRSASPKVAENPAASDGVEKAKSVACPVCGGKNSKCSRCHGDGKVSDWGPSTLDAVTGADENNTGLSGPEPKMDKKLWTPESVKPIREDVGEENTEHKDAIEPIIPVNDDPLKEIGENHTEHQTLPAADDDSGFDSSGINKGGDSWSGPKAVDPVTHDKSE